MALTGSSTYVGFGFGAIQSGLFLYEAYQSGAFGRLVISEVLPELVSAVRRSNGECVINIAHEDHVEKSRLDSLELENPAQEQDRMRLIDAIAEAREIGTAVPSVDYYVSPNQQSLHRILAQGLSKKIEINGPRAVIYTAENNNQAAEILKSRVIEQIPAKQQADVLSRVCFLNTVIGKMSQVLIDPVEIHQRGLAQITPDLSRAVLVESFNRILISRIQFDAPFQRGIAQFIEKDNLLPFEEAKLYGHNATHALGGYLGSLLGMRFMADLHDIPGFVGFLRQTSIEESGKALIRKYSGVDALFTPQGYRDFIDDLLQRMVNPFLLDRIERVTRDPARKLGWNDRLIGTMRLALEHGLTPKGYALGAAAALAVLNRNQYSRNLLEKLWEPANPNPRQSGMVIGLIEEGWKTLEKWNFSEFPNLEVYYR